MDWLCAHVPTYERYECMRRRGSAACYHLVAGWLFRVRLRRARAGEEVDLCRYAVAGLKKKSQETTMTMKRPSRQLNLARQDGETKKRQQRLARGTPSPSVNGSKYKYARNYIQHHPTRANGRPSEAGTISFRCSLVWLVAGWLAGWWLLVDDLL